MQAQREWPLRNGVTAREASPCPWHTLPAFTGRAASASDLGFPTPEGEKQPDDPSHWAEENMIYLINADSASTTQMKFPGEPFPQEHGNEWQDTHIGQMGHQSVGR